MKETNLERKKLERGQKIFYGFLGIIFLIVSGTLIPGHFQRQYLKNNPRSVILTKEDPMDNRKIRTLPLPSKYNYSTHYLGDFWGAKIPTHQTKKEPYLKNLLRSCVLHFSQKPLFILLL